MRFELRIALCKTWKHKNDTFYALVLVPVSLQDSVFVETYKDRSPRNPSQRYYQLSAFGSLLGLNCTYLALFFFHHSFPSHPSRIDINLFWALLHQASAQWKAKQPKCAHTQPVSSRETVNHTAAIEVMVKGMQFAEQPPDGAVSQVSFEVLTACRWHFKRKSSQRPRKGHFFIPQLRSCFHVKAKWYKRRTKVKA